MLIESNIKTLGAGAEATVLLSDAARLTPHQGDKCTLIFLDPPYGAGVCAISTHILERAAAFGWVADNCLASIEAPATEVIEIAGWSVFDQRRYGKTSLTFLYTEKSPRV